MDTSTHHRRASFSRDRSLKNPAVDKKVEEELLTEQDEQPSLVPVWAKPIWAFLLLLLSALWNPISQLLERSFGPDPGNKKKESPAPAFRARLSRQRTTEEEARHLD